MWQVEISKAAEKSLKKAPIEIKRLRFLKLHLTILGESYENEKKS